MEIDLARILAFLFMALIAGAAAAAALERNRRRRSIKYSPLRYLIVGTVGAFVGQFLFAVLEIDLPSILSGAITMADIIIAFVGAILVLVVYELIRR